MPKNDITTLPLWAQNEIKRLRKKVKSLEEKYRKIDYELNGTPEEQAEYSSDHKAYMEFADLRERFGIYTGLVDYNIIWKQKNWITCFNCKNSFVTQTGTPYARCIFGGCGELSDEHDPVRYHKEKCPIDKYEPR
jgi:hypothetical protein